MNSGMIIGWLCGFLAAALLSFGGAVLLWPHDPGVAFLVGALLGGTLPLIGAFAMES